MYFATLFMYFAGPVMYFAMPFMYFATPFMYFATPFMYFVIRLLGMTNAFIFYYIVMVMLDSADHGNSGNVTAIDIAGHDHGNVTARQCPSLSRECYCYRQCRSWCQW